MTTAVKKLQNAMKEEGIEAFYVESEVNRLYLTSFKSSAGIALILKDKAYFFTDFRYIEAAKEKISGFEVLVSGNTTTKNIVDILASNGVKKIGFENNKITYSEFERLKKRLSPLLAEFVPAEELISKLRMVKTKREIERIKKAQEISELAFYKVLKIIKTGMTEKHVAAELEYAMKMEGGESLSFPTIAITGTNTSRPHGEPGDKKIKSGDFVTMDFGCTYEGYCADMTRTVAVGKVTKEMEKVYETVRAAIDAAHQVICAGKTGEEIDFAARKVIYDAGYEGCFGHSLGHSVGVEIHEEPVFAPYYKEKIPENSVVSVEPGIYLEGRFGVRIEDLVVVTKDGFVNLNGSTKELIVL